VRALCGSSVPSYTQSAAKAGSTAVIGGTPGLLSLIYVNVGSVLGAEIPEEPVIGGPFESAAIP
jgi:hypothetical protein